jgi:hypothetical protein
MPFIVSALSFLGDLIFRVAFKYLTIFARASIWNIALATLTVIATGAAITLFINLVTSQIGSIVSQASAFPAVPYFLPSNITTCLSAYITIKLAGTVFNGTLHFIENRSYILKA